jgi:hypothetical protein
MIQNLRYSHHHQENREYQKAKNIKSTVVQLCGVPVKSLAVGNKNLVCYCSVHVQEETFCDNVSTGCAIYKNSVKLCDTVLKCPISNYMQQNKKFHVYMTAYTNFMSTETQNRKFKVSDIWGL